MAAILGILAVAAILSTIAVLTAVNLQRTSEGINAFSRSHEISDTYSRTTIAIALVGVFANEYRRTGDPVQFEQILAHLREMQRQVNILKSIGTDEDRAFLAQTEQKYSAELQNVALLLNGALLLQDDPSGPLVLNGVVRDFVGPATEARARGVTELKAFESGVNGRSTAVLGAFLAGLPLLGLLIYLIVISERRAAVRAEEIRKLGEAVLTDGLTGLHNHRAFQEDLQREVSRASRAERPLSVAIIDLDDFKEINDSMGHARGDAVLSQVGKLMSFLRGEDRAYRVGGDEFALILPDADIHRAQVAIERLRQSVAAAINGVTISAGISANHRGVSATAIRDHADLALYEAKHRGKNQAALYSEDLDLGSAVTADKMTAIRDLLKNQAVSMWFQPIFRLQDKKLFAFESLLRMPDSPELSGPEEAFEIAQRMGRSHDLDLLCTGGALDAAGDLAENLKLFINLDPATLVHSEFSVQELLTMVRERGIDPGKVVFEITEKTVAPMARLAKQVDALRECGFGVALDDVGAGNSGLEMLRVMKFDYVKIDQSVVLAAMDGGPGRAVILAIVAFAREAGAFMIAEGIEDLAMLQTVKLDENGLQEFWVQGVQGFFFGKPRPSMKDSSDLEPAAQDAKAA